MNYYFRVDGGNIYSIATGHITRCLKLADYISSHEKAKICFIMKNYSEGVRLVKNRYQVRLINKDLNINDEVRLIRRSIDKDSDFICDLRNINNGYISKIKENCNKFILFDDLGIKNLTPHVLINPTPFCYLNYNGKIKSKTTLLLGEKFFFTDKPLIKKAFTRKYNKRKYNILASFGGADPCNITNFFLKNIAPNLKTHRISVILGPANQNKLELIKNYRNKNIKFYTNLTCLSDVFSTCDIAFVCAGDTCIESCVSGLATFIISSIYYEKKLGQLLHKKKMAYFVADIANIKMNKISARYLKIMNSDKLLREISSQGRDLVDGEGLERVYAVIKSKS